MVRKPENSIIKLMAGKINLTALHSIFIEK